MTGQERGDFFNTGDHIARFYSILCKILHYMYTRIYLIFMMQSTVTIECLHISELLLQLHVFARVTSLQCFHNCILQRHYHISSHSLYTI
jgi:hypothetical protein